MNIPHFKVYKINWIFPHFMFQKTVIHLLMMRFEFVYQYLTYIMKITIRIISIKIKKILFKIKRFHKQMQFYFFFSFVYGLYNIDYHY